MNRPLRICKDPREKPKAPAAFYQLPEIIQQILDAYAMVRHLMERENRIRERMLYYANSTIIDTDQTIHSILGDRQIRQENVSVHIANLTSLMMQLRSVITDAL